MPSSPSADEPIVASIDRRLLLRGGAILAGAAGATAVGAALAPPAAQAADGDQLLAGRANATSSTTTIKTGGFAGSGNPALTLSNAHGPALRLEPLNQGWDGELEVGEMVADLDGPKVGVRGGYTTYLATGIDLDKLPLPIATTPTRILDTRRYQETGTNIAGRSSSTALDSQKRLTAGSWIDVAVGSATSQFDIHAVFANLTTVHSTRGGFLTVYPATESRPLASTLNYSAGAMLSNALFVGVGLVDNDQQYAIRIYSSATTHVILDLTGATVSLRNPPGRPFAGAQQARGNGLEQRESVR